MKNLSFTEVLAQFDNDLSKEQIKNLKRKIVDLCVTRGNTPVTLYRTMNSKKQKINIQLLLYIVEILGTSEKNLKKFYQIAEKICFKGQKE